MDRQAWWLICTIIILSPFTLMGATPPIVLFLDILCMIACLLAITSKRTIIGESFILSLTLPFLLISTYFAFQIIPQAPSLLKLLVPGTWQTYQETIWKLSPGVWMPISNHVEATVYAWFHICAIWAFCLTFCLMIDSHWHLFRLVQIFVLAVIVWSLLIIVTPFIDEMSWLVALGGEVTTHKFRVVLGLWIVVFLPVLFASYTVCRSHGMRNRSSGNFRNYLKTNGFNPHITLILGLGLSCIGLLMLFVPALWLAVLIGYLLFRYFKPSLNSNQQIINKKIVLIATCLCVIGLLTLISLSPSISPDHDAFGFVNIYGLDFTWLGYGLGAHADTSNANGLMEWGGTTIAIGGGLAEIWTGMGSLGAFLMLVAMLALYHGAGGRESINANDRMTSNLHAGGIAGIALLLITGGILSLWQWQSMIACIIYLTLIVTWCRRLSHMMTIGGYHKISKVTVWGLRVSVCVLLTASLLLVGLKTVANILVEPGVFWTLDKDRELYEEETEQLLKALVTLMPYNSDLSLALGQEYLIQKRDKEAKAPILSALRMRPLSPQAHVAVASFSACLGDEHTAMQFLSTNVALNYVPDKTTERLVARLLGLPQPEAAIKLINLTLESSPQLASRYLHLMTLYGFDPLTIKSFLPEQPLVMLALGDLLVSGGHNEAAENVYLAAVFDKETLNRDETLYLRIARYFLKTDRLSEALVVANEGKRKCPKSLNLKALSSELYAQLSQEIF